MIEQDDRAEVRPLKVPLVLVTIKFLTREEDGRSHPVFHDRRN
jgi:hypothetical protein